MQWKIVFLACLALASAAPRQEEMKRRAMEQTLDEIMQMLEARDASTSSEEDASDEELGDEVANGDYLELKRYMNEEMSIALERAQEKRGNKRSIDKPHVFYFLIDDLGYNDVGWNNPDVISPNLDALANSGIILDNAYAQAVCSPSRGALMTGLYPMRFGMQHGVIMFTSAECGPLDIPYLPEKLKELDYDTHMLGKWHLGFCNEACTPPQRGFDTFYGFYQGFISHYHHMVGSPGEVGYDFHKGSEHDVESNGTYASDLLRDRAIGIINEHQGDTPMFMYYSDALIHTPAEVDAEYSAMYPGYANDPHRQHILGMVSAMDDNIGAVVQAIKDAGLYDNSVIIFQSDNGGEAWSGSNIPFRGAKASIYEGGVRTPAFIHSPLLSGAGTKNEEVFHITDWHASILSWAGGDPSGLDGVDQTELLMNGGSSVREEVLYTIDDQFPQYMGVAGIRVGDWKVIKGYPGVWDGWEGDGTLGMTHMMDLPSTMRGDYAFDYAAMAQYISDIADVTQLYNLADDPEERNNLAASNPDKVAELLARIDEIRDAGLRPPDLEAEEAHPAGDPSNYGGFWESGWC